MSIEQDIVHLLKSKNESGLRLLYGNYSEALYGIAYRTLGHQAFAEDALQKSFLKIWNGIDQYDNEKSTLFTWMARIVRNSALDIKRLKSFQKEEKSESINLNVHNIKTESIDTDKEDIRVMISGMDEKYAFVLEYLYLKGFTQSELSKEFDIPLGTIKTRVRQAILILREKYKGEEKYLKNIFVLITKLSLT